MKHILNFEIQEHSRMSCPLDFDIHKLSKMEHPLGLSIHNKIRMRRQAHGYYWHDSAFTLLQGVLLAMSNASMYVQHKQTDLKTKQQ